MLITHHTFTLGLCAIVVLLVAGCARTPKWTMRQEYGEYDWIAMMQKYNAKNLFNNSFTDRLGLTQTPLMDKVG